MDITIHDIIKGEDIRFEGIEYMPTKLNYYSFAVLVSQIIRRHHNIVVEISSYRSRVKEIELSIVDSADISEFDVININDIKRGLVEAFNKFRVSEKQVKMYVLLYNIINACYSKCVSWCKGLSKDDIMKMVFAHTGIEMSETVPDRYQHAMNNTQADIKANTAAVNYDKMFQFAENKKLKLDAGEQDQSYRVSPEVYDNELKQTINVFISTYINTGTLENIFHDDTEEIIARIKAEQKTLNEALLKQKEEEENELENDEIMQILNLSYNSTDNNTDNNTDNDNKSGTETPDNVSGPELKRDITSGSVSSTPYPVIDDNIIWESKERNRYNIINKTVAVPVSYINKTETEQSDYGCWSSSLKYTTAAVSYYDCCCSYITYYRCCYYNINDTLESETDMSNNIYNDNDNNNNNNISNNDIGDIDVDVGKNVDSS